VFHGQAGFFVVGPGHDGWEYSALLITSLAVVAWDHRRRAGSRHALQPHLGLTRIPPTPFLLIVSIGPFNNIER
jgi:hypothetical protein